MKKQEDKKDNYQFCNWCCQPTIVIWVHGHGQCSMCGINIDECCSGEMCNLPAAVEKSETRISDEK